MVAPFPPPGMPIPAPRLGPQDMAGVVMGQLGQPPPGVQGPPDFGDPVLGMMESNIPPPPPPSLNPLIPDRLKPGYMPQLDDGVWKTLANKDQERYRRLVQRIARDVTLYRGKNSAKPPGFDPKRELAFKSATLANIVNKMTNMCAPLDFRYEVPFKDEQSKQNSQIVENWYEYLRTCEEIAYAEGGGHTTLQQDEFLYDLLHGRICCRILPAPERPEHPFHITLLDPATVFPAWGGDQEGLVRITHRRQMTAIDVISTYLPYAPNLTERIKDSVARDLGFGTDPGDFQDFWYVERELTECWNTWSKHVTWGDVVIQDVDHKLGYVPFIYVMARGEPRGMTTPLGRMYDTPYWEDEDYPDVWRASSEIEDEAEKGVSVFHHIVATNRMTEVVYSLILTDVLRSSRPPTITYLAPTAKNNLPPTMDYRPGMTNYREINAHKVELVPTSTRPTDASPVLNKLAGDIAQGSISPSAYGDIEGSNISGFAIERMVAETKDSLLPYLACFEVYQAQKSKMCARMYQDIILPMGLGVMSTPMDGKYGSSPSAQVTAEVLRSAGINVTVQIIGVSDQQLPALVNAAGAAVERGFWSRRKAMEKLGEKDPSRMMADIITERALEHPEMMENFLIPITFIKNGQKDLADLWVLMVVMPKIQMLMMKMLGPMANGAQAGVQASGAGPPGGGPPGSPPMLGPGGGGPSSSPAPPEPNGLSNPMVGRAQGPPTGPQAGQGRGPAPVGIMG